MLSFSCEKRSATFSTIAWLVLWLSGCGQAPAPQQPATGTSSNTTATPKSATTVTDSNAKPLELIFPFGSEKEAWIRAVTDAFHAQHPTTSDRRPIHIVTMPMGSGELITEVLEGRLQPHLLSPASGLFITLGNADSQAKTGKPLVGETHNLVMSPVVIAMWRPMAEAIGWGKRPVGWGDIIGLVKNPQGWAAYGFPQWGPFKFGHTHPEYSNSGLISIVAAAYAGAGKVNHLSLDDLKQPRTADLLGELERAVVHYGSSTGFFGKKMFAHGPEYLSAAVLYENMVIESYDSKYSLPFPLVAIYPAEGTFWSDHPVGIVDRPWVSTTDREAAEKYIAFLTAEPQQQRAMEFGFRPADVSIRLAAPLDAAHGIDPAQPLTTLEVPSAPVLHGVLELWKQKKKHSNIVLALDISGSMKGEKMDSARKGAQLLVDMLGDEDLLSLLPFNEHARFVKTELNLGSERQAAHDAIGSYYANGGTALYDAIHLAHRRLIDHPTPERISAIVVLSDGADHNSKVSLQKLLDEIHADAERPTIRVFTIAYGSDADESLLKKIAEATEARSFIGTPQNIREVFREISTFF